MQRDPKLRQSSPELDERVALNPEMTPTFGPSNGEPILPLKERGPMKIHTQSYSEGHTKGFGTEKEHTQHQDFLNLRGEGSNL